MYALVIFGAGFLSLLLTPAVRLLAQCWQIYDYPTQPRKIHSQPVPLLGGLAIFFSVSLWSIVLIFSGKLLDGRIQLGYILAILLAGAVIMLGGWLDDRLQLPPTRQFIFPLLAVLIVVFSGISIREVTNPLGGVLRIAPLLGIAVTIVWLLGMSYTTKFLDGFIIFGLSLTWDVPDSGTTLLALLLCGACLGFLVFNWHPAKIFLGEGGSLYCGFMLGVLAVISGSKIATTALILGIPILDAFSVIVARLRVGRSAAAGDQRHLHYRLLELGITHRQAVVALYCLTAGFGVSSLFLGTRGKIAALFGLAVFMSVLLAIVFYVRQKKINT